MFSPLIAAIGAGLVFWNLTTGRPSGELYAYQVLMGLGVGGALQVGTFSWLTRKGQQLINVSLVKLH